MYTSSHRPQFGLWYSQPHHYSFCSVWLTIRKQTTLKWFTSYRCSCSLSFNYTGLQCPTGVCPGLLEFLLIHLEGRQSQVPPVCRLQQIQHLVGLEVTVLLVLALIMLWLDCCNSTLASLPQYTTSVLQQGHNAAACLVFKLGLCDYVSAVLIQ